MQTRIYCALMAIVVLIGLSVDARAQGREKARVMMDQQFTVRGVTLPAGEYEVRQMDNWSAWNTLLIQDQRGHAVVVPVRLTDLHSNETVGRPSLVLQPDAEGLTLKRVLLGGQSGFEVIESPETN